LLVDSHCHLNYLIDADARLRVARQAGVGAFLCVGVAKDSIIEVLATASHHEDVWASVGQHPEGAESSADWVEEHLGHPRVVAVGEIGLDYHFGNSTDGSNEATQALQRERFDAQLALAARADMPVIIHTREAEADTLALLQKHAGVRGVLHCFTESWTLASAALDLGYYISISGIVTFNNGANVREVARQVPRERLLIETDCPWLAPVPHRGKTNEPAYVADTARFLADFLDWPYPELAQQTTRNFYQLFTRARPPGPDQNSSS
jgi:TatD DNase family protein